MPICTSTPMAVCMSTCFLRYQTLSWNYDDVLAKETAKPSEICIRMAVQNLVTLTTWQMDFGAYASKGDRHQRCLKFCDFTMPFSYATKDGGYCPSDLWNV